MADGDEQLPASLAATSPAGPRPGWTAGRVIGLLFAGVGGLIGLALLAVGIAVTVGYIDRDDGYFTTDRQRLESGTYAITTESIDLGADEIDWAPAGILGDIRFRVEGDEPVFVGIGRDEDVDRYLGDVASDELVGFDGGEAELARHEGKAPRTPPGEQGFWVAEAEGAGEQALTWDADFGRWTAVVMNAGAARGIDVEADAGVELGWAIWAGLGLLVVGLLAVGGAVTVIVLLGRRASRDPAAG
ncbi:MAG: hypothetical protein EDQ89_03230 [Acidobacteria bacterium]|nr:MAG: hypothetical protein EDQ89_03230 [Acidobacteriota bacterium]GIK77541.1 MAG: hypothetical protein BroJett022_12310 [Actinomycetes bacterium]